MTWPACLMQIMPCHPSLTLQAIILMIVLAASACWTLRSSRRACSI